MVVAYTINKFVVANSRFDKAAIKQITYRRLGTPVNQKIENGGFEQIDSTTLNRRLKNGIIDAESDGKAQLKSDHFPVKCKIACRFKKKEAKQCSEPTRYSENHWDRLGPRYMNAFIRQRMTESKKQDYHVGLDVTENMLGLSRRRRTIRNNGL